MKQGGVAGVIFHQRITKLIHDDEIGAVDQSQVVVHGLLLPRLRELGHQVICADKYHAVSFVDDGFFPKSYGQMGFPKPGLAVKKHVLVRGDPITLSQGQDLRFIELRTREIERFNAGPLTGI